MIFDGKFYLILDILLRIVLWTLFVWLGQVEPHVRVIQLEEQWLYQNPYKPSYVSSTQLWLLTVSVPLLILLIEYGFYRDSMAAKEMMLGLSLNYGLSGVLTQCLKIAVGRPRPDFYFRCFPNGAGVGSDWSQCTQGNASFVSEGRKSFPSGHACFAFASMTFLSLYLCRKLHHVDNVETASWRLCACLLPLFIAIGVSISRICDYRHHFEDISVGGLIGITFAYLTYHLYLPHDVNACRRNSCSTKLHDMNATTSTQMPTT